MSGNNLRSQQTKSGNTVIATMPSRPELVNNAVARQQEPDSRPQTPNSHSKIPKN